MPSSRRRPQRRPGAPARGRATGPGDSRTARRTPTAPASPFRSALERRSRPALVVLSRQPRWLVPGLLIALMLVGLFLSGPGAAIPLLVVAVFLTWLLLLSWPAIRSGGRVARIASVLVIVAAAGWRAAS